MDAASWLPTDGRSLPTGIEPVAGSPNDFRGPRLIGDTNIDYPFTDLARGRDALAWVGFLCTTGSSSSTPATPSRWTTPPRAGSRAHDLCPTVCAAATACSNSPRAGDYHQMGHQPN
ncbi:MAG: hypothetical protein WA731_17500 [Pseudonocardiaceae bacterium]